MNVTPADQNSPLSSFLMDFSLVWLKCYRNSLISLENPRQRVCVCAKQISRFGTFPPFITFPQLTSSVRLGFHPNFFNIENWEGQSGYKARFSFEIKKIVVFNQRHMHHTLKAQRIHVMLFRKSSSSLGNSYTIQEYNTSTR